MKLAFSRPAEKDFAKLDKTIKVRIREALDLFCDNPELLDIKKLKNAPNRFRLRIGNWRVIFGYYKDEETVIVQVLRILHRKDVYRK